METQLVQLQKQHLHCTEQIQLTRSEKESVDQQFVALQKSFEEAVEANAKEFEQLKSQVKLQVESDFRTKEQLEQQLAATKE